MGINFCTFQQEPLVKLI
ncbi:unnamed protein product [Timema podura]|uniref:Uncharacterized protein n=1 Tax=Timema podura TaxID=61482 RepID=A0ABN7NH72_TIMPD|nr:unnamed protein product [Timema podura]